VILHTVTDTYPLSGIMPHIVAGTFDGTTVRVYADGIPGSGHTGLDSNTQLVKNTELKGSLNTDSPYFEVLSCGSQESHYVHSTGEYHFSNNNAFYTSASTVVLDKGISSGLVISLTNLLHNRIF
jgi:hypothetical protein